MSYEEPANGPISQAIRDPNPVVISKAGSGDVFAMQKNKQTAKDAREFLLPMPSMCMN